MFKTVYRITGDSANMYEVSAKDAVARHPEEWSFEPWPEKEHGPAKKLYAAMDQLAKDLRKQGVPEAEIAEAQQKLRGKKLEAAPEPVVPVVPVNPPAPLPPPSTAPFFEAQERGQGWWWIVDADGKKAGKAIREDDAKAFNAMSLEERAEYVAAETAQD